MKKIVSIVLAIVLVAAMSVSAFALNADNKVISTQVYAQPNSDWSWFSVGNIQVPFGETVEIKFTDFSSFANLDSSAKITFGIQNVDGTLDAEGDTSKPVYTMSDVVIKAAGYDDYVIPAAKREPTLTAKTEAWGLAHVDDTIEIDVTAACGSSDFADHAKYLAAITEVSYTLTYVGYNGEVADGASSPADEAPADETPADTAAPADETPADETPAVTAPAADTKPADTGIVLAVLPMAVAAAAVVASKRR